MPPPMLLSSQHTCEVLATMDHSTASQCTSSAYKRQASSPHLHSCCCYASFADTLAHPGGNTKNTGNHQNAPKPPTRQRAQNRLFSDSGSTHIVQPGKSKHCCKHRTWSVLAWCDSVPLASRLLPILKKTGWCNALTNDHTCDYHNQSHPRLLQTRPEAHSCEQHVICHAMLDGTICKQVLYDI
jgi:hypothetical protein